ncbi:MAG: sigma-70 family RNA polymerase sigma factor [Muricomes sp.]
MEGKHPKRRKDKYNPYDICEQNGHYYISFKDGQGIYNRFEINKMLYEAFNSFELEDLSYFNVWDRHIEQSEIWDSTLNTRAFHKPHNMEESVLKKFLIESLHMAIGKLTDIQRRRLILYYFEDMTYEQIAQREGCTKVPVKRSIDAAIKQLEKELKNFEV